MEQQAGDKLTEQQIEVLQSGASAVSVSGRWIWRNGFGESRGRAVHSLRKRGLIDVNFYSGGKADAWANDAGRAALTGGRS